MPDKIYVSMNRLNHMSQTEVSRVCECRCCGHSEIESDAITIA